MMEFRNILFVSHGVGDESESLKQAMSLARNNKAALKVLVLCPEFGRLPPEYREKYESSLVEQLKSSIDSARAALRIGEIELPIAIEVESGSTPAVRTVRQVLRNGHDLIVKEAELGENGRGFKAIDMELLRKCPCPLWLCRKIIRSRSAMNVAVAVDPESEEVEARDLSLRLLKLSRALADSCSGSLSVVSCWEYEFEEYLRHNPWTKMPEDEISQLIQETSSIHYQALEGLIGESGIGGKVKIDHLRGDPGMMIPEFVRNNQVDVLVMGTVARTGIASFIIGNTSENILQKVSCSVLALKPNGFVSPIKAY